MNWLRGALVALVTLIVPLVASSLEPAFADQVYKLRVAVAHDGVTEHFEHRDTFASEAECKAAAEQDIPKLIEYLNERLGEGGYTLLYGCVDESFDDKAYDELSRILKIMIKRGGFGHIDLGKSRL